MTGTRFGRERTGAGGIGDDQQREEGHVANQERPSGTTAVSRRRFLQGAAIAGATAFLAACSSPTVTSPAPAPYAEASAGAPPSPRLSPTPAGPATPRPSPAATLNVANWPAYIDEVAADPSRHPTLEAFTRKYGTKVAYRGAKLWTDSMAIPRGAAHKFTAELFIDFVYDPKIAAQIAAFVRFISPVKGCGPTLAANADEAVAALAADPLMFPDEATFARTHSFATLSAADESYFDQKFAALQGG